MSDENNTEQTNSPADQSGIGAMFKRWNAQTEDKPPQTFDENGVTSDAKVEKTKNTNLFKQQQAVIDAALQLPANPVAIRHEGLDIPFYKYGNIGPDSIEDNEDTVRFNDNHIVLTLNDTPLISSYGKRLADLGEQFDLAYENGTVRLYMPIKKRDNGEIEADPDCSPRINIFTNTDPKIDDLMVKLAKIDGVKPDRDYPQSFFAPTNTTYKIASDGSCSKKVSLYFDYDGVDDNQTIETLKEAGFARKFEFYRDNRGQIKQIFLTPDPILQDFELLTGVLGHARYAVDNANVDDFSEFDSDEN